LTTFFILVNGKPFAANQVASIFRSRDDFGSQVIPTGYYFVLADHRTDGSDSRQRDSFHGGTSSEKSSRGCPL